MNSDDLEFIELNKGKTKTGDNTDGITVIRATEASEFGVGGPGEIKPSDADTDAGQNSSEPIASEKKPEQEKKSEQEKKQENGKASENGKTREEKKLPKEDKKRWIVLSVPRVIFAVITAIVLVVVSIVKGQIVNSLDDQNAAKQWSSKGAGQVSLFLDESVKADDVTVGRLKNALIKEHNKLAGESAYDETKLDEGPFISAYSGKGSVSISSEIAESSVYSVLGVGGDYFYIHKPVLMSGDYLYPDSSKNLILLDSLSAFKLFGSVDIVGEKVMVNGITHFVSGVYKVDDSGMSKRAGSDVGFVYMTFDALSEQVKELPITCIEFVGTNPTEDFMMNTIKEASPAGEDRYIMVENDTRFGLKSLLDNLVDFPSKVMMKKAMVLPFWENIARGYEEICSYLLVLQALCWVILAVLFFMLLDKVVKSNVLGITHIRAMLYDSADRRRARRRKATGRKKSKKK